MIENKIWKLLAKPSTKEDGFRLLVETYQERAYWHIRRMVISHEDANDVLQNSFIKIFKSIDSFQKKSKLFTWIYRICTNEALHFMQKQKLSAHVSFQDYEQVLAKKLRADSLFDGDEAQLLLQKAIWQLPEKQRLVFHMRYFDELKYKDMAKILKTSEGALKASYHHSVKKIKKYLEKH